jgi:YfiH family protein
LKRERGLLVAPALRSRRWLRHGFGTRAVDPDLGLPLVTLKQIHSDVVRVVDAPATERLNGDALLTATPGLALGVASADCLPLLLADTQQRVVAAVHAGWRGTAKRLAEKTVGVMRARFGTNPRHVIAALGPSIQACCYEVGEDVIHEFAAQFEDYETLFTGLGPENPALVMLPRQHWLERVGMMRDLQPRRAHLDLVEANRRQLLAAGVPARGILAGAPCTACRVDLLRSYRREGRGCGRLLSVIAVIP